MHSQLSIGRNIVEVLSVYSLVDCQGQEHARRAKTSLRQGDVAEHYSGTNLDLLP